MSAELTPKQSAFVQEYLIDLNATQAAIRAGYSEDTARSIGNENLTKPNIAAAIEEAQQERLKRTHISQDRVLKELARLSFSDLRNVLTPGGSLIDPQDWDDDTAAAISSIEVVTVAGDKGKDEDGNTVVERTHKIKVWDKNSALEKLGKHMKMFTDKTEVVGDIDHKWTVEVVSAKSSDTGKSKKDTHD